MEGKKVSCIDGTEKNYIHLQKSLVFFRFFNLKHWVLVEQSFSEKIITKSVTANHQKSFPEGLEFFATFHDKKQLIDIFGAVWNRFPIPNHFAQT